MRPPPHSRAMFIAAQRNGELAAGAVVLAVGNSLHYIWGATNRDFRKQRPGEAIQWHIIRQGVENGYAHYDLEGIDPTNNPGVAAFKRKLGGQEIHLAPTRFEACNMRGALACKALTFIDRLRS